VQGGLTWKRIDGHEYLTRYFQDPVTRKQVWQSLGRRSLGTEGLHARFLAERGRVRSVIRDLEPRVRDLGRVGRALRLARIPAPSARVLRRLWLDGLMDEDLALAGPTAIHAYDMEAELLAPAALLQDPSVSLIAAGDPRGQLRDRILASLSRLDRGLRVLRDDSRRLAAACGELTVEVEPRAAVLERVRAAAGRMQADTVAEALEESALRTVALGRDSGPVDLTAVDPRAYALLTWAARSAAPSPPTEERRARYVADLVASRSPEPFRPMARAAFPELSSGWEGDGGRPC
jgi:hypothetical protein